MLKSNESKNLAISLKKLSLKDKQTYLKFTCTLSNFELIFLHQHSLQIFANIVPCQHLNSSCYKYFLNMIKLRVCKERWIIFCSHRS